MLTSGPLKLRVHKSRQIWAPVVWAVGLFTMLVCIIIGVQKHLWNEWKFKEKNKVQIFGFRLLFSLASLISDTWCYIDISTGILEWRRHWIKQMNIKFPRCYDIYDIFVCVYICIYIIQAHTYIHRNTNTHSLQCILLRCMALLSPRSTLVTKDYI